MASKKATTTLNKLALTLASLNATKSSRIPLSRSRAIAIAIAASARTFSNSAVPFSRPNFVPESRNAASTKYLANAFTRNFHSTTPNFFSATSSSQANQNEFIEMACEGIISAVDAAQNSKHVLGDKVFEKWGADLPFLFKVLSVRVRSKNARGQQGSYPIKLFYTSNMPIILQFALVFNLYFISQLLYKRYNGNFLVNLLGKWKESKYSGDQFVPVSDVAYYITAPSSSTTAI
ncbi:hypothetical protein ACFX1X_027623 [Malus domestica]